MSTGADMRLDSITRRRYATAAFLTLLLLSVSWPSPIVSINRLWIEAPLAVDEMSFLGREAPAWDVAFWCLAGLLLIAIVQSATEPFVWPRGLPALARTQIGGLPRSVWIRVGASLAGGVLLTTVVWWRLDGAVVRWAETVQSDRSEAVVRILNRLGGGMNPGLVVIFLLIAGLAYGERRWTSYSAAMAASGLTAGLIAQAIKHLVGRARPELWVGASHYAPGASTSFPSGHTVGAFALAGVLIFASPRYSVRLLAFLVALSIGLSRILAFRHWASDVSASAVIGLVCAYVFTRAFVREP